MVLRFSSIRALKAALGERVIHDPFPGQKARSTGKKRRGPTPHDILWEAVRRLFPDAVREMRGAVPGRRFRLDIAIQEARLAIEVDGWQWHGRHKRNFARDRERQNLLTLHGWRILRFSAGQIIKDLDGCIEQVKVAVNAGREKHAGKLSGRTGSTHEVPRGGTASRS